MKKRTAVALVAVALCLGIVGGAFAASNNKNITALLNADLKFYFNGTEQHMVDANGKTLYPISYEGSTYLPVRSMSAMFGQEIGFDMDSYSVYVGKKPALQTGPGPVVPPATGGTVSSVWADLEFKLDGVKMGIPAPFTTLQNMGWTVDFSDYKDMTADYVINPGDKTFGTVELSNSKYDEKFKLWVGFINTGSAVKKILECDIWSIETERVYGGRYVENAPTMEIAGGLTWGSTKEQVLSVLGQPKDSYRSDSMNYDSFTYDKDYHQKLKLYIYDDFGLVSIQLQNYDL